MENDSPGPEIILASSSVYRQRLLHQLGLNFRSLSPDVDESVVQQDDSLTPLQIAERLAKQKAESIAKSHPQSLVIGSDQVCVLKETVLCKPESRENNIEQLKQLCGTTHHLITAVCICLENNSYAFTNTTALTMRNLSESEITRYVERDQAYDCAGGYRWEAAGIALFEKIETEDHTAILGLPLIRLVTVLRTLGIAIP